MNENNYFILESKVAQLEIEINKLKIENSDLKNTIEFLKKNLKI